jgi:DNA-binding transcriptional MocR family regulator
MATPTTPLYEAIFQHYKVGILSGEYAPGSRLPTEKEIARIHSVSRITATRAFRELELAGYIRRVKGSGSYVSAPEDLAGPPPSRHVGPPPGALAFISLVLPFEGRSSWGMLKGIEDVARRHGHLVTFHDSGDDPDVEKELVALELKTRPSNMAITSAFEAK